MGVETMSSLPIAGATPVVPPARSAAQPPTPSPVQRRVRHQARESLAVMALSVALSGGFATVLLVLTSLGR
jgi:hypothetical protein